MKILLVDDSQELREYLRTALELAGHTVHLEGTMRGAMDALYDQEFDCLVADGRFPSHQPWQPPQDWGVDLLRVAKRAKVKGVLYSGDDVLVCQARQGGFTALLKPASITELVKALESCVAVREDRSAG